jgi:hypothetical protein
MARWRPLSQRSSRLLADAPKQIDIANSEAKRLAQELAAQAKLWAATEKGLFIECHFGLPPGATPVDGVVHLSRIRLSVGFGGLGR